MRHWDLPTRRPSTRAVLGAAVGLGLALPALALAQGKPAASSLEAERLFASRIWPLISEKCLACHGAPGKKVLGGLDLGTQAGALKGGARGKPSLVAGKPEASPFYLAVTRKHERWPAMPPKENDRLTPQQLEEVRRWIAAGAPWPDAARRVELLKDGKWDAADGVPVRTSGGLSPEWTGRRYKPEDLWAYRPLRLPKVPSGARAGLNPVDAFLEDKLALTGLRPAPRADRRTLIRRVTFDLTGLPPTPAEVEAFVRDPAPEDQAWAKVVDRLLASPHYGERWARHWLDVVRYADSSGFANDYERGNAWRYRDYVVRSFNQDKPYDRFIREQIAGDEIDPQNPELLVATGFLRMGPWELTGMEVAKVARQRFLDDVTDSVGQVFLGHALQCARCHDHKFDPVPTRDYYGIQAAFATTQLAEREAPFLETENTTGFEERKYLEQRRQEHLAALRQLDEQSLAAAPAWYRERKLDPVLWEKTVAELRVRAGGAGNRTLFAEARSTLQRQKVPEGQIPPRHLGFEPRDFGLERIARKCLERLRWEMERYEPFALSVYSGHTPDLRSVNAPLRVPHDRTTRGELEQVAILAGGDPFSPTVKVVPGVLSALASMAGHPGQLPTGVEGRRRALADWIASPRNPLTARVIVNRVWSWHFGQAIAGNPNNFGATGKKPTHPELLDYLAFLFTSKGTVPEMQGSRGQGAGEIADQGGYGLAERQGERGPGVGEKRALVTAGTSDPRRFGYAIRNTQYASAPSPPPPTPGPAEGLGWSIKALHRLILTSEAYRRSAVHPDRKALAAKDPHGTSYAVFKTRRLTAEELRDSMLAVSGELNRQLGGIPARPEINLEAALQPRQVMGTFAAAWQPSPRPEQRHRRSLYVLKIRGLRDPFMEVFNEPSPDLSCEAREASTVTPQVFSLFNSQSTYDRALAFAARLRKEAASPDEVVRKAFLLAYGRAPKPAEAAATRAHWQAMTAGHQNLKLEPAVYPREIEREAVEENTGEKFRFTEKLHAYADFVPDLQPHQVDAEIRGLAEVCLVLFNANEFSYVY